MRVIYLVIRYEPPSGAVFGRWGSSAHPSPMEITDLPDLDNPLPEVLAHDPHRPLTNSRRESHLTRAHYGSHSSHSILNSEVPSSLEIWNNILRETACNANLVLQSYLLHLCRVRSKNKVARAPRHGVREPDAERRRRRYWIRVLSYHPAYNNRWSASTPHALACTRTFACR